MSDRELAIAIMKWEQEGAKLGGPLHDLIEEIKQLFIEQACEAVDSVTTNSKAPGFNNGYDHCKEKVKQAIRDKFK